MTLPKTGAKASKKDKPYEIKIKYVKDGVGKTGETTGSIGTQSTNGKAGKEVTFKLTV